MKYLARGLGWLSIGLGVANLVLPARVSRAIGIGQRNRILRSIGVRELASAAMLMSPRLTRWGAWSRVAGDAMDSALLLTARRVARRKTRFTATLATLVAIGIFDLISARRLSKTP